MEQELFSRALGVSEPWLVAGVDFDEGERRLTVRMDFRRGSRFAHGETGGAHPMHVTQLKRYRHLNFFQHECLLEARMPRVRLPDDRVALVEPPWSGRLSGFTLLYEALILSLCREMPFQAVSRLTGESWHRVRAVRKRYVEEACEQRDPSDAGNVAIDETSRAKGHKYVTTVADAGRRRVVFLAEGRSATTIRDFADDLLRHGGDPSRIFRVSIDMSAAFIKGVRETLPNAD